MSKYDPLWSYIQNQAKCTLKLSFDEIQAIIGIPIDHSLLTYKKELLNYGYCVKKISLKEQTILFHQMDDCDHMAK